MRTGEAELLRLILAETVRVEGLSPHRDWFKDDVREWLQRSRAIDDLHAGFGVRVSGEWLGKDAAGRKARQRGLESLERSGLIELHAPAGTRRTHVRITAVGSLKAKSRTSEGVSK